MSNATAPRTILALAALAGAALAMPTRPVAPPPEPAEPPFPVGQEEGPLVEAALWVERGQVVPGSVVWVAVSFKIKPEWHIYWPGQNDTGMAPSFDWHLPEGWKIGAARWPAPTRYVGPGEMVDHILEGLTTVLFPVLIPPTADAGSGATISCDLEWLVCKSLCIAERQRVQFSLSPFDVNDQSTNARPQDAAVIAMGRKILPGPIDAGQTGITASVTGNTLTIRSAGGGVLSFAPGASGRAVMETLESCVGQEGKPLYIGLEGSADEPVEGVVTLRLMGRAPQSYTLRIPKISDAQRDGFEIPGSGSKP